MLVSDKACQSQSDKACRRWSPMRHVGFRWVSDEACRGLWSGMLVSDGSLIRHVGLRWVSDNNSSFLNSLSIYLIDICFMFNGEELRVLKWKKIILLQKRDVRLIDNSKIVTHNDSIWYYKILKINDMVDFNPTMLMFKHTNGLIPIHLKFL